MIASHPRRTRRPQRWREKTAGMWGGAPVSFRRIAAWLILAAVFSASLPFHVKAQQPYILAAEDVLEVVVFGNADVSRAVTIRPDGMISLPLIGEVAAAGLTPEQLRRQLTQLFASFLRNPQVAVIVREFHKVRVSVLGQVTKPGVYELAQGATGLDALAAAEVTLATVVVAKQSAAGIQLIPVDLLKVIREGDVARDVALRRGDVLYVPENPIALENIALLLGVAVNASVLLR